MLETHPFGSFIPKKVKYLILGSFTTKEAFDDAKSKDYTWFYANGGRNQFWPILEEVYGTPLKTRSQMQALFTKLEIALADIIYQCERVKNSNLDVNLINITYAIDDLTKIITSHKLEKIFFTSRFVETKFRKVFKDLITTHLQTTSLITLPSPSPRYALMTKAQKLERYKQILPKTRG